MSLFEKIKNKRYDLQENKKKKRMQKDVNHGLYDFKKTGGFEDVTGEGPNVNPPKTRKELEVKRKEYEIDPKTNQPSKSGIEKYARKMKRSNLPLTQDELDKAKKRMVGGEAIYQMDKKGDRQVGTTTGKYGGRLANTRSKNAPSYAEVKAKIDAKNPVIQTPIGPLPKTAKNMKKFPKPTFKSFAKKQGSKALKFIGTKARNNKLATAAIAIGAGAFAYDRIKKAIAGPTLKDKDFTTTKPIQDRSGKNVKFTYGKDAKDKAMPYLTKDKIIKGKTIPGSLTKFKTGDYKVATKSGANYNVNDRIKNSAFEKQLQKAEKNPNKNKNKDFLKKFKNATRPT